MEDAVGAFVPITGIIFVFGIPIIAIIFAALGYIRKKRHDAEVRIALIQNGVDAETAKVLLANQEDSKSKKFQSLRTGCAFLGVGLGAATVAIAGIPQGSIYFWLVIAAGVGVGLVAPFVIEYMLTRKEKKNYEQ